MYVFSCEWISMLGHHKDKSSQLHKLSVWAVTGKEERVVPPCLPQTGQPQATSKRGRREGKSWWKQWYVVRGGSQRSTVVGAGWERASKSLQLLNYQTTLSLYFVLNAMSQTSASRATIFKVTMPVWTAFANLRTSSKKDTPGIERIIR